MTSLFVMDAAIVDVDIVVYAKLLIGKLIAIAKTESVSIFWMMFIE